IASELFTDILQVIDRLHTRAPPIVHRNINPQNILVKYDESTGSFVKLGGFGLAVEHRDVDETHTQCAGVDAYMAPEVKRGRRYNQKCDMYSLGVLVQDLFNVDVNQVYKTDDKLNANYEKIRKLVLRLLNNVSFGRPSAHDLLVRRQEWALPYGAVRTGITHTMDA
ncbi:unnamed protein product, partial [Oppiella nova]